jgi:hypothetical protein
MDDEVIKIKQFDFKSIPKSSTWIIIGPPESGKTYFMQFMIYALKHIYPVAYATCGTEGSQDAFTSILGNLWVDNAFDEDAQIKHAKRQKLLIQENEYPYMIEMIDDCSDDPTVYNKKIVLGSFKNGRQHWKRLFVVGLQYALDMKPSIRKLVSFVVLFREPEPEEREKIYKNFGGICGSKQAFNDLMDKFTGNHQCLILKKCAQSNKLEDCVFWFKCPGWRWQSDGGAKMHAYPEGWTFGCREYRDWAKQRLDLDYKEDIV